MSKISWLFMFGFPHFVNNKQNLCARNDHSCKRTGDRRCWSMGIFCAIDKIHEGTWDSEHNYQVP